MSVATVSPVSPGGPPGDPALVRASAGRLSQAAAVLADACRLLPAGVAGQGWSGVAANAFGSTLAVQQHRIRLTADSLATAAELLGRYAGDLAEAQRLAARGAGSAADPAQQAALIDQAVQVARGAARRTAVAISTVTSAAPPRPAGPAGLAGRLRQWQAEVGLGADESSVELLGSAYRLRPGRLTQDPIGLFGDFRRLLNGTADAAHDPLDLLRQMVDADTWRSNPARALGHLVPDALAAVATGGTAAVARRSTAATARAGRQSVLKEAAAASRSRFVGAAPEPAAATGPGWVGAGLRLEGRAEARVQAYWRAVQPFEARLTEQITDLADLVGARLEGLEHRVKGLDSLNRKVAEGLTKPGASLQQLLAQQGDTLRYTFVLPERRYAAGVRQVAEQLDRADVALTGLRNTWSGGRYRAVNSTWTQVPSGLRFELQFHTPATWRATVLTHPWYATFRLPDTPMQIKAILESRIAAEYAAAAMPRRVGGLTEGTVPAARPVGMPVGPAATAAGTVQSAGAADQVVLGGQHGQRHRR